jgi:hypothetical protein
MKLFSNVFYKGVSKRALVKTMSFPKIEKYSLFYSSSKQPEKEITVEQITQEAVETEINKDKYLKMSIYGQNSLTEVMEVAKGFETHPEKDLLGDGVRFLQFEKYGTPILRVNIKNNEKSDTAAVVRVEDFKDLFESWKETRCFQAAFFVLFAIIIR